MSQFLYMYPSYFCDVISLHSLLSFQSVCTLKVCYSLRKNASNVNYTIDPQICSLSLDQDCFVQMTGFSPRSFLQKKNLANIQPSWSHTCKPTKETVSKWLSVGKWDWEKKQVQSFVCNFSEPFSDVDLSTREVLKHQSLVFCFFF